MWGYDFRSRFWPILGWQTCAARLTWSVNSHREHRGCMCISCLPVRLRCSCPAPDHRGISGTAATRTARYSRARWSNPGPLSGPSEVDKENRQHGLFKLLTLPFQVTASARRSNGRSPSCSAERVRVTSLHGRFQEEHIVHRVVPRCRGVIRRRFRLRIRRLAECVAMKSRSDNFSGSAVWPVPCPADRDGIRRRPHRPSSRLSLCRLILHGNGVNRDLGLGWLPIRDQVRRRFTQNLVFRFPRCALNLRSVRRISYIRTISSAGTLISTLPLGR
jgi:hypothetical protein